jgi:pyruvate dehydrogenase E1 component
LSGEGLQHQDGSSHVVAATVPNCRAYDPAFAGELAVIVDHGMRQMLERGEDVFYYVTVMNENYAQPTLPQGCEEDVVRGMYRFGRREVALTPEPSPARGRGAGDEAAARSPTPVRLLGSGAIFPEVIAAADLLAQDFGIDSELWSVTSFSELAREAREVERWNRLHLSESPKISHVARCLAGDAPIVAATDYVRAYPQLVAPYVDAPFVALGTDGFGRSDTRQALRRFFEIDRHHVVIAALDALARAGRIDASLPREAISRYAVATEAVAPWLR